MDGLVGLLRSPTTEKDPNWQLAEEVESFVRSYDEAFRSSLTATNRSERLRSLVNEIRRHPEGWHDLPDHFYLSESAGERCALLLALERQPQIPVRYLRWLVERVVVEGEFAGRIAAQALTCAYLRLSIDTLYRGEAAVKDARELLSDRPGAVEREVELKLAEEVIVRRRNGGLKSLPRLRLDHVRAGLGSVCDRNALLLACEAAGVRVRRGVNLSAPDDHVIFCIVRMADDSGKLPNLLGAAFAALHGNGGASKITAPVSP
jgi:hypothetical protein